MVELSSGKMVVDGRWEGVCESIPSCEYLLLFAVGCAWTQGTLMTCNYYTAFTIYPKMVRINFQKKSNRSRGITLLLS